MKEVIYTFLFFIAFNSHTQELTGQQLLDKAIAHHDLNNAWPTFNGSFKVTMTTPNQSPRISDIIINLPAEFFSVTAVRDTIIQNYTIGKNECRLYYNGNEVSGLEAQKNNMSCDRANLYKNYYTYLYGLPMKLKDKGTKIDQKVKQKSFKGKEFLVLKASYNAEVGSDVWYFYFNPKTYAMEVYQFYKTDEKGNIKPDSGEYIILSEEEVINSIKMPKIRAWYYNKDDKYLGTDTLGN